MAGMGTRKLGVLAKSDGDMLSKLVYNIALPAFLFHSVSALDLSSVRIVPIIVGTFSAYLLTAIIWMGVARIKRLPNPLAISMVIFVCTGNHAYVGLPIIGYAYGEEGLIIAAFTTAVLGIWVAINTLIVESKYTHNSLVKEKGWFRVWLTLRQLLRNPLLLSAALGLTVRFLNFQLPLFIGRSLELLGNAASPVGLLAIGLNIQWKKSRKNSGLLISSVLFRLFGTSLILWVLLNFINLSDLMIKVCILLLATPGAVTSFVITKRLGGDDEFAAEAIILSSLLSPFTMGVIIYLFELI